MKDEKTVEFTFIAKGNGDEKPTPKKTKVKKSKKSQESTPSFDPKDFGIDIDKL